MINYLIEAGFAVGLCGIMWLYGRYQYKQGMSAGLELNLKLRLLDIEDKLNQKKGSN